MYTKIVWQNYKYVYNSQEKINKNQIFDVFCLPNIINNKLLWSVHKINKL